jgi:hypothetical protein
VIEVRHKDTGAVILRYEEWAKTGTLVGAQLAGANLEGVDLDDMEVGSANLQNARLAGAVMRRSDLSLTRFRRAHLQGADLQAACLAGPDLKGANLEGANLTATNLTHACLLVTLLRDARLDGADLACAYYDERTEWPTGFEPQVRGALLLGQPLDLGCADYWKHRKYGPHMVAGGGSIAEPGEDEYRHRFGGDSWRVLDPRSVYGGPTLLLTLDLADPRLAVLRVPWVSEIPLASYLNCDAGDWEQRFRIEPETQTLLMVARERDSPEAPPQEYWFPNPLPETRVRLRPMNPADWPIDEESYNNIRDSFLGGPAFIRVLGPPLWVQAALEEIKCACGMPMCYVCGLRYESDPTYSGEPSAFLAGAGFEAAETAHHFFWCQQCRELLVIPDIPG